MVERTRCPVSAPWAENLGLGVLVALPLEGFRETLIAQVFVPQLGKVLMLCVKLGVEAVHAFPNEAAPLLDGDIIVSPVVGVQVCATGEAKLEEHFGVAHGVTVLLSVVADRDGVETARAGLVGRFDHQRHIRWVLDAKVEAVIPASG